MTTKVDVVINVYGKPNQTLCTLKSLMKHSGEYIDKIYFIEELKQPYDDKVDWVKSYFDNIISYTPNKYEFMPSHINMGDIKDVNNRYNARYQYGIENSDKKHIFLTHNDVLYTDNIIKNMLQLADDNIAGIGQIGVCWNCPANKKNLCSGERFYEYNPTYNDILKLLPYDNIIDALIDKDNPKPLPSCRINEWACLINRNITMTECVPKGTTPLFGVYDILDVGMAWFKSLHLKGYEFIDYRTGYIHGYWANNQAGYPNQLNSRLYKEAEQTAKEYFENNFI